MQEGFVLTREEGEALIERLRDGFAWKCCGGPHTAYPKGNPHGHAVGCPVRDLHNALDPRGPLAVGEAPVGFEACAAQQPGEVGPYCRKPRGHEGPHRYA